MATKIVTRNIVVFPGEEVTAAAIAQGEAIAKRYGVNFILNRKSYRPHITLYQFAIPEANLNQLTEIVATVAGEWDPFSITMAGLSIYGDHFVFWDAAKDNALADLHEQLVTKVNPLRDGYIPEGQALALTGAVDIGTDRRQSLGRWGHSLAMDTFWPHITLAHTKSGGHVKEIVSGLTMPQLSCRIESLHITEVGPFGTCPGPLMSFPLEK